MTPTLLRSTALFLLGVPAASALVLTGTQSAATTTLDKGNHTLKGTYVVPEGKKLEIKSGASITVEKGASIDVKGELVVAADATAPAVFKGAKWRGIHTSESAKASVTGLQVTGADIGLCVEGSLSKMEDSVFMKNAKGLKLDGKGSVTVVNCLFADNASDGMRLTRMSGTVEKCSFIRNKGYGLTLGETNPKLLSCLFQDNTGGGVEQSNASSATHTSGTNCAFEGKALAFVSGMSHGSLDFPKCWWGDKNTAILKSKGQNAVLPNVKDARNGGGSLKIDWTGFLTSAPKPVGATVTSRL